MIVEGKSSAVSFKNVVLGVVSEISQEFIKLAALNPLKNALFGTSSPTLGGGGFFGSLFSGSTSGAGINYAASGAGQLNAAFADGGSFEVGPGFQSIMAGRDNRLVQFAARDGERVTVETPGQQRMKSGDGNKGMVVNMTLNNPTRDSIPLIIEQLGALGAEVKQTRASIPSTAVKSLVDARRRNPALFRG
jgi:hypothetical protein